MCGGHLPFPPPLLLNPQMCCAPGYVSGHPGAVTRVCVLLYTLIPRHISVMRMVMRVQLQAVCSSSSCASKQRFRSRFSLLAASACGASGLRSAPSGPGFARLATLSLILTYLMLCPLKLNNIIFVNKSTAEESCTALHGLVVRVTVLYGFGIFLLFHDYSHARLVHKTFGSYSSHGRSHSSHQVQSATSQTL